MSSIQGFNSITVDHLGADRYRVANKLDQDGDGVADGKSLSGGEAKIVNEGAINQMLALYGLKAANGSFAPVDGGWSPSSTNINTVTNPSDPVLPDVGGPSASPDQVGGLGNWLQTTQGIDDAALMWSALSTLATTAMRDMQDAKQIKNALQSSKLAAKENEIKSTEEKIAAEQAALWTAFAAQVAAAAVSMILGSMDAGWAQAGAQGVGGSITAFQQAYGKSYGNQAEADAKQIESMRWQKEQDRLEMGVEDARANYDEAKELFKLALKIMNEHVERQTQVVQTITRG